LIKFVPPFWKIINRSDAIFSIILFIENNGQMTNIDSITIRLVGTVQVAVILKSKKSRQTTLEKAEKLAF